MDVIPVGDNSSVSKMNMTGEYRSNLEAHLGTD
jgi:hypothetical protein